MFVSNFYSFPLVQEFFGEMAKVKEESKIISTDKGETFSFPFYVTKPSLLTFPNGEQGETEKNLNLNWKGKLPKNISASFIGLFCSFQHLASVKIIWKCVETGKIGVTQSEIGFQVLSNPNYSNSSVVLGVLKDAQVPEKDLDEIFPDDLIIKEAEVNNLIEEINNLKSYLIIENEEDVDQIIRSIVESDCGYNRSISAEINGTNLNIGKIYLRKTFIHPGTQIFIKIDLNLVSRINLIKLKLECIETYPIKFIHHNDKKVWRDTVKEMKISPGCQDRLEIIFPVSPELISTVSCPLFDLKWELAINFKVDQNDFDLKIPLNFISFKFELNKKI